MDIRKIKKLIELLEESGIAELEITEGDDSVRIARYGEAPVVAAAAPAPTAPAPAASPQPQASAEGSPAAESPGKDEDGFAVKAPMVGTFYSAPAPGSAPFVQIGDRVNEGDTLCIVEAMKMMNPIETEVGGVVKSIRCQNGEAVEFGQVLFVIDQRAHDG